MTAASSLQRIPTAVPAVGNRGEHLTTGYEFHPLTTVKGAVWTSNSRHIAFRNERALQVVAFAVSPLGGHRGDAVRDRTLLLAKRADVNTLLCDRR